MEETTLRRIKKQVRGMHTVDGAGVHLTRVLGHDTVRDFDPFLMLDSFDSENPSDYIEGFPMHPHRGIETITYLIEGEIDHKDSLGNEGRIGPGQSQWMTAGSGILHQEMPQASPRMLGLQLWLNLPQDEKMTTPHYFDITHDMIGEKDLPSGAVRVIAGEFDGVKGVEPYHIEASLFDVTVNAGNSITIPTKSDETVFAFIIEGDALIGGNTVLEKTAVLFGEGGAIEVAAPDNAPMRFIFASGKPLHQEVSWGGPIVMNTRRELETAFDELRSGTFIKHKPSGVQA